jgi:predicted HicB family RNase H-like nuclease
MTVTDCQRRPVVHSRVMRVRLSPELLKAIGIVAKRRGMSTSAWLRQAATTCAMLEGIGTPSEST